MLLIREDNIRLKDSAGTKYFAAKIPYLCDSSLSQILTIKRLVNYRSTLSPCTLLDMVLLQVFSYRDICISFLCFDIYVPESSLHVFSCEMDMLPFASCT